MIIWYVVEGFPADGYYGHILLYMDTDKDAALNPDNWKGDYSHGICVYQLSSDGLVSMEYYHVAESLSYEEALALTIEYGGDFESDRVRMRSEYTNDQAAFIVGNKAFYAWNAPQTVYNALGECRLQSTAEAVRNNRW